MGPDPGHGPPQDHNPPLPLSLPSHFGPRSAIDLALVGVETIKVYLAYF